MRSQWEEFNPARCREELKTARCGRHPSSLVIGNYARDMENGRWRKSPEPIIYDGEDTGDGVLRDGQQRSYAVIRAGTSLAEQGKIAHPDDFRITLWVTRGTTREINEAFPYLNIGKNRNGADYLATEERANPTLLYAVARRVVLWQAKGITGNAYKPTRAEVLETLSPLGGEDPEAALARIALIEQATDFAARWKSLKPPVPAAVTAGFLHWLLGQRSARDRDAFLEHLRSGAALPDEADGRVHPARMLRGRLHADYYDARQHGTQVKQETVLYLCLRAWDAWRRHEDITKLQMPKKLTDASFREPR
jgi:hypothetical protein